MSGCPFLVIRGVDTTENELEVGWREWLEIVKKDGRAYREI
jgi:hypothetical protein